MYQAGMQAASAQSKTTDGSAEQYESSVLKLNMVSDSASYMAIYHKQSSVPAACSSVSCKHSVM